MCYGETCLVVGTSMMEFKALTKYFNQECLTTVVLDLISCGVKGEGLIQGQCGGEMKSGILFDICCMPHYSPLE